MIRLSETIKKDILNPSTTLNYIAVIYTDNEPIYIANQKQLFEGKIWEDYNFQISNITESLDLNERKFQINNVTLKFTNTPINNKRFSDMIFEFSLMNKTVDIFFKTNSCRTLQDCALVYRGKIKKIRHDEIICQMSLEDNTEDKLSKKVPRANMGYKKSCYNKEYFGRPIPILYGEVDKAPAIPVFEVLLDENDSLNQNRIYVIADDTRGDRNINLGGFFHDKETQHINDNINPLYIYKDDYFQVLTEWTYKSTFEENLWSETEQYIINADEIEINKKFEKAEALNPPANNELECIKKRRPNDLMLLQNPSASDDSELTSWEDSVGFGVRFTQESILSPSSCFDTPESVAQSSNFYSGNFSGYLHSYSQIPNQTIPLQEEWDYLCVDFRPCHDLGVTNIPDVAHVLGDGGTYRDYKNKWQYETMSWILRYAHFFNDETNDDDGVVFIKLPSIEYIGKSVNRKLWEQFADDEGVEGQIYRYHRDNNLDFPEVVGMTALNDGWYANEYTDPHTYVYGQNQYFDPDGIELIQGINATRAETYGNASVRINSECNMTGSMLQDWMFKVGGNNTYFEKYYTGQYLNYMTGSSEFSSDSVGYDFPINFGLGYTYALEYTFTSPPYNTYYLEARAPSFFPITYEMQSPPFHLLAQGGLGVDNCIYPKLRIQLKSIADTETPNFHSPVIDTIKSAPISETETAEYNVLNVLSYKYVTIGLEAGNSTNYRNQGGAGYSTLNASRELAKYFDLFDIGLNDEFLFDSNDFPIFKPITATNKTKEGNSIFPYYTAYWNGVPPQESPDAIYSENFGSDIYYFGGYNRGGQGEGTDKVREKHILGNNGLSATNNDGWAIWVKKDISEGTAAFDLGQDVEGYTTAEEYNEAELKLITVKKNTLLPMVSVSY